MKNNHRQGSIPAVVGLTAVLATLGAAAVFMTNGMNRVDRRADLSRKASWIASTAAEETILGLMNGAADWTTPVSGQKNVKLTFPAPATSLMYGATGALVEPVKVMGRRLDGGAVSAAWRNKIYGALSAGPFWSPKHVEGWESMLSPGLRKLVKPPPGVVPDPAVRDLYVAKFKEADGGDTINAAFQKEFGTVGSGGIGAVADALDKAGEALAKSAQGASCGNLTPDVAVLTAIGGLAFGRDPVEDKGQGAITSLDAIPGADDEPDAASLAATTTTTASTRKATAEEVASTINQDRKSKPFSVTDFRALSEKGGVLRKDRYLVTIEASASIEGASMEIAVPHVTHRVFARLHYGEAMLYAYGRMLAYIGYHYNCDLADFKKMGMVDDDGVLYPDKIMESLEAAYTARPGPQAWPFPVASSIVRVAE